MHTDSIQWQIEVDKKDIAYIVSIFDGYENLAVVRTLDASRGLIELLVSPDYLEDTRQTYRRPFKRNPTPPSSIEMKPISNGVVVNNGSLSRQGVSLSFFRPVQKIQFDQERRPPQPSHFENFSESNRGWQTKFLQWPAHHQ